MLPQRSRVKRACVWDYFSARETRKSPARRFTYHSDGMADARLFEMLDAIAIQVSPHSYRPVIEMMFFDGVVNDGRLCTLRCFTSLMMIKFPWGKDYIRFEYKKFVKRLTPDRHRRHPRDAASTDLPAYHRCYSPPPPSDGAVRFVSPPFAGFAGFANTNIRRISIRLLASFVGLATDFTGFTGFTSTARLPTQLAARLDATASILHGAARLRRNSVNTSVIVTLLHRTFPVVLL